MKIFIKGSFLPFFYKTKKHCSKFARTDTDFIFFDKTSVTEAKDASESKNRP